MARSKSNGRTPTSALLLAMLIPMAAGAAAATGPDDASNPHLQEAMRHIELGDLVSARAALDEAMAHPENTNRDLVEIYATLAVVHLYAGAENLAYEAYARLLNIDPGHELPPHAAEPLRELFQRVARAYEEGHLRAVRVAHDPPGRLPAGVPAVITATISNMPEAFTAHLRYRLEGKETFESRRLSRRPGHRWAAALPMDGVEDTKEEELAIEYYVEVTNEAGHRVQGSGSAREPHLLRIVPGISPQEQPPPSGPAWYQQPWVWGAVGGVALGTAAAVYLSSRPRNTGTLPVRVRIREDL